MAFQTERSERVFLMRIYLAGNLSQGNALTKVGKKERLISYYYTTSKKEELRQYVKTGRND
jgi:hypothetical protein